MMPLKNKNYRKSYNNTSPPSCPRQPFSSIFTKKNNNNNNKKRPSSFSGAVRVKNYVVHLSTSTPVIIARTHTIKLLHICGLISDKMCHLVTKCCHFVTKLWQNKGSAGWKLCGGGGSQKTIPVTDTSKFKKEKNIKNYYYYNNYTTILSGERYLAKNAKKQVRFLHTKHSTKYLCLKKLKKNLSRWAWRQKK